MTVPYVLPSAPFQTINGTPNVYNRNPASLLNFRTALFNSAAGLAKTNILCIGDSTTIGTGSVGSINGPGEKTNSYPSALARQLTARGYNAGSQNFFGDGGYGTNITTYDSRLSLGSWSLASPDGIGGQSFTASATTASPLAFTPSVATDTCEIYYFVNTGTASAFNSNVNGGTNTLTSTYFPAGISKVVISGALGMNTYNTTWASGGQVFITGFSAYDSTKNEISVLNCGWGGSTSGTQASLWPSMAVHVAALNPSLIIVQTGINDWFQGTGVASYAGTLQTWINSKPANADMIIMSSIASSPANEASATVAGYLAAQQAVASFNGLMFVDQNTRNGGYSAANTAGLMASDGTHGSAAWYGDEANFLASLLTQT